MRGDTRGSTGKSITQLLEAWPERLADQRLLRESLAVLRPLPDAFAHLYPALFRDRPHLRALFPDSLDAQRGRLARAFMQLIEGLDKPDVIVPIFEELGQSHVRLGVRPIHYEPFGDAFIESLRITAGPAWRPEYTEAWRRAYRFLAEVMSNAADRPSSTPPYIKATVVYHELRRPNLAILRVRTTQPYPYLAGQFATIESPDLPNTWRSYSMADPPGEDSVLEFHVRANGNGRLSDLLVHKTAVGDELRIAPARGSMTLAPDTGRNQLLIAGGTGLAPIRALLGELARRPNPPVTWLFFGARERSDLYDLELLNSYADRCPWLRLVPVVAEGDTYPYEPGTVVDAVTRRGNWVGYDAYLSGPPGMIVAAQRRLVELGVEPGHIRYDEQ
jgi:NAD(P)H-flavin reductase/hemoglobin-like flavoprotein